MILAFWAKYNNYIIRQLTIKFNSLQYIKSIFDAPYSGFFWQYIAVYSEYIRSILKLYWVKKIIKIYKTHL